MPSLVRTRDLLLALAMIPGLAAMTAVLLLARLLSGLRGRNQAIPTPTPPEAAAASILIAGRPRTPVSQECLDSVAEAVRFDGVSHEVIVIDGDAAEAERIVAPVGLQVRFLAARGDKLEENWHLGIEAAGRDLVVLLAGNAIVGRDFLRPLLSCFGDPHAFAAAPRPASGKDEILPTRTGKTRGEIRNGEIHLWHAPRSEEEVSPQPVLWASRHGCAYHRARFLALGGFDPLFSDSEIGDVDLCFRAWRRGWHVLLQSQSVVRCPTSTALDGQPLPSDLLKRDHILLGWKLLASPRALIGSQLALAARLLAEGSRGRLNLRPLRHALRRAPRLLLRGLAVRSAPSELSDEEVFRVSSHRYYLRRQQGDGKIARCRARGEALTPTLSQGERESDEASAPSAQHSALSTQHSLITHHSPLITPLRILLVCPQLPYPPVHGAAVRMWNLLKALAARHRVDLLSFAEAGLGPEEVAASVERLRPYCGAVRIVVRRPDFCHPSPLDRTIHVEMFDCPEMREALLDMVDRGAYDVIQFDKTELGQYALPGPAPAQVLVEHIIFYHAFRRQFLSWRRPSWTRLMEYLKLRRYELEVCRRFDGVITMSRVDADFLGARLPSHRSILDVPNGVDTGYYRYSPSPGAGHHLLFIGNFEHSPNVEGMDFFLRRVFPLIKASLPEVRLLVVGPDPHRVVARMVADPSVVVTGLVEDTRSYMEKCSVFVAPILAGSGTRLKILEAMSSGIPVVSTALGAEGLEIAAGTHLMIADEPVDFAHQVMTLLRQPDLRPRLRANARSLVEERYDWGIVAERLEGFYRELANRSRDKEPWRR